ncbi:MAG: PAQR family membrane homeostasis protein TrhA [Anaerorhabdus sp.]
MKKLLKNAQDKISFHTHFIGIYLSVIYFFLLEIYAILKHSNIQIYIGFLIFTLSSLCLYSSSALYHYIKNDSSHKIKFRKLDHAMIYVLIAGSYTPIVLNYFSENNKIIFLVAIWLTALFGVVLKLFWINSPRIVSTLIYLILGWSILFDIPSLLLIPSNVVICLVLSGISYSVGAIIYIIKKPNITLEWGFHEIFHIFILLGTFLHFIACIQMLVY